MNRILFVLCAGFLISPAHAEFTGDVKLACEAILCLSTGQRPSECSPSIKRYFDIQKKKWSKTVSARRDFLNQCPEADADDNMRGLVNAIANGAGQCDAAALNVSSFVQSDNESYIANDYPTHCDALYSHAYTDLSQYIPRYVGAPSRGGYWVEAKDYDKAKAEYDARIAAEDAANAWGGGT
ncbi:MAG: conjugal transfer protein TrbM [Candidatus Accumulibacter sp.]|nr:conjugal transfer protein TrbM [Accumulibacter sp.]